MNHSSKIDKVKCLMSKNRLHLFCPGSCNTKLIFLKNKLKCTNKKCIHSKRNFFFSIKHKTPILISEENCDTLCSSDIKKKYVVRNVYSNFLRKIVYGVNPITKNNCQKFLNLALEHTSMPLVLVIGSGETGNGTERLFKNKNVKLIGVDIYENENVDIVCDGHYLPFNKNSFDGVWIQAVLEHVVEPNKVVNEIYRVLKKGGVVYAETPFMQQVHEGKYDFTRFTILGHRYLFKKFKTIDFGGTKGAEVVLAWSLKYFVWGLFRSKILSSILGVLFYLIFSPFKYFLSKSSMYDSCSGSFFLGKKSNKVLTHKELINLYKGNM